MKSRKNKTKMNYKKITINTILVLVIACSIFFTIYPPQMLLLQHQAKNYVKQEVTVLKQSSANKNHTAEIPEFAEPTLENLAVVQNMQKDISGKIVIPAVGINLPITQGIEDYKMLYAAGEQYDRSVVSAGQIGNYVLASHSTPWANTLFTNLLNLQSGSEIYVSDEHFVYEYEVIEVKRVLPHETSDIQQYDTNGIAFTQPMITLYTCTDADATGRYVVRGVLTHKTANEDINQELRKAFEDWHSLTLT